MLISIDISHSDHQKFIVIFSVNLPLAARYNWCQGPVPGRGPAVEKHGPTPCYRSAGHRRFRLRATFSRVRDLSRGFKWDCSLAWCLELLSWMTFWMAGIPKSLWIMALVIYHGASAIALSIFDWHRCMIAMLDLEAQPTQFKTVP
jgi:hypothetical protein